MSRVLILIGAVIACALTALIVVPRFVDWNHYRGTLEAEASRLLGRQVSVRGEVNLRLLPTPYIRFDDVRIADVNGGAHPPIFKADSFTVRLAPGPLFRGALEASRVELIRPVLTLVTETSGGGNWASLGENRTRSVFMPSSVTLHAVHITDGAVVVQTPKGDERTRLEIATGEFSATALEGPYKLHAMLAPGPDGDARELRLSTARPEADGSVRFKGTLRGADGHETYAFDGLLSDLTGRTRVVGELTAVLPLPGAGTDTPRASNTNDRHGFDLRAKLNADTQGVALTDIALSFDNAGRPQLVTGEARLAWQDASSRIHLESRWLDLDRIAGRDGNTAPLRLLARLAGGLDRLMPATGRTEATFALDQATLGGDVVSGLRLQITKENGGLTLNGLHAGLPAGTRLDAEGVLTREEQDIAFSGNVTMHGASLNRFLGWARRGEDLPELRRDGSFTMRGKVSLGANRFAGRDMVLQLAGSTLAADVSWSGRGRRQLAVSIEGPELDVGPLLGNELRLPALVDVLLQRGVSDAAAPARNVGAVPTGLESTVQVRVGRLVAGSVSLRDVVADVALDHDSLKVALLKFTSDDGAAAEFSGTVTGLAGNNPRGSIGGQISAAGGAGISRLAEILALPGPMRPSARRAGALTPLRLAGTLAVGARGSSALDLAIDGMLAGSRLTGRALLDSPASRWREQRIDVTASLDGQELSAVLAQMLPDTLAAAADKGASTPARVTFKAVGVPARSLASLATFDAAGLSGEYRGRLAIDETGSVTGEGDVRFTADDVGRAAALVGLASRAGLDGVSAQARLAASLHADRLELEAAQVTLGNADVAGRLAVGFGGERPHIGGHVRTSELSMQRLIAVSLASPPPGAQAALASAIEAKSLWPDGAFDLKGLADFDADVRIETPIVRLAPDIAVADAALEAQVAEGQANIKLLSARGLAGKAAGRLAIGRIPSGIRLQGEVRLTNAALEAFVSGNRPAATGPFSLELDFSSLALSPRGLIATLRGKGAVMLGDDARLYRLAPGAVNAAALAALAAPSEGLVAELRRRLQEGLAIGAQALGPRRLGLELADGVVRLEPLTLETSAGRVTADTTIDLEAMKFDSEWRIEPRPLTARPVGGKGALPGISMVYVGPLSHLGSVEPRLQSEALERELGVRKMERYVDELERVRREDEERVRQEAERQRNLERERQRLELERQDALRRSATELPVLLSPASDVVQNLEAEILPETAQPDKSGTSREAAEIGRPAPPARQPAPTTGTLLRNFSDTRP